MIERNRSERTFFLPLADFFHTIFQPGPKFFPKPSEKNV